MIYDTWIFLQILIGYNLMLPLVLFFLYTLRTSGSKKEIAHTAPDYAIIVTAFEQTDLLPSVVESILNLKYQQYLIYIVADKCDISNLHFDDKRVVLLRPEETLASNTRSHFYAIRHFKRNHNRLTIIDSDNLVHTDYLTEMNKIFDQGFAAVQGIREAKNLDTTYACLDAARDIYYHYYDGEVLFKLGSSATLSGSGMAFETELYKSCLGNLDITGAGFDKVLQYEIVKRGKRIAFSKNAIVYDQKTTASDQLVKQRSRWINTWFKYFKYGFILLLKGVKNFNLNQFLFGVVLLRPPLFLFLILSFIFMIINIWVSLQITIVWVTAFLFFLAAFVLALWKSNTDQRIYNSLVYIPKFMFYQMVSLLKARTANKRSIATKHMALL